MRRLHARIVSACGSVASYRRRRCVGASRLLCWRPIRITRVRYRWVVPAIRGRSGRHRGTSMPLILVVRRIACIAWSRGTGKRGQSCFGSGGNRRSYSCHCQSGCCKQALSAHAKVECTTRRAFVILRGQFQERHGFLHKALRGEQIGILEIAIVQASELVRLDARLLIRCCLREIGVDVADCASEYRHLLHKGLERMGMGGVPRAIRIHLARDQRLLLFHQLLDPDVQKPLQPPGREIRERRVLSELTRSDGRIGRVRGLRQAELELETLPELLGEPRELLCACKRA